jgi:peroxiredoxin (alkyl hydroperoxide reductase subunit C)
MPELDEPAPDFTADATVGKISLSDFRNRWVVLFAYPADFTPICEMDIVGFARNKARFDDLGVQFIGWSVDSVESHGRWIREVKDRTGVEIDYPLIADVSKALANRYGILHKTKGVTYRGVFVVDPDGVLKFEAIYPLDVGRSIGEVERIIKVLQRARELSHLEDLDRARQLSKYSRADEAERTDSLEEAKSIVQEGQSNGIMLRLIGGLAIRFHCHGRHSGHLRDYHDIDIFGLGGEYEVMLSVFQKLGYVPNLEFDMNFSRTRCQFIRRGRIGKVDVFLDKFRMDHGLDFRERIRLDDMTIPITDLLLTKLQIQRLGPKDKKDIVAILEDHDLGHSDDKEILNVDYMADLCARDWGLYKTVTDNLHHVREFIEDDVSVQCIGMEATELIGKLNAIRDPIISRNKGPKWKVRSLLGQRVKWYEEVDQGIGEAA